MENRILNDFERVMAVGTKRAIGISETADLLGFLLKTISRV